MKKSQFFAAVICASALLLSSCTIGKSSSTTTVKSVSLDKTAISIKVGEKEKLTATVTATKESYKEVTWESDKPSVATVDQDGYVTAVAEGSAVITVTSVKKASKKATCAVTVTKGGSEVVSVTGVTLDKSSLSFVVGGADQTLVATVAPSNATNKNVTWSSNATNVATVSNGIVHAVGAGSATITVTTVDGNKTANCSVSVSASSIPVTGVSLNPTSLSMRVGDADMTLTATVAPSNATNKNVSWSSSDPAVATVSNGAVHAVAKGSAVITVTTQDGNKTATCAVSVAEAAKTDWSAAEKAILNDTFYGVNPPYHGVADCGELEISEYSDTTAYAIGGTSSADLLDSIAAKFPAEWDMTLYSDGEYAWVGELEISATAGTRYVQVQLFGVKNNALSTDGSGEFYYLIMDPYFYDWESFAADNFIDEYAGWWSDMETEETVVVDVPAFDNGDLYLASSYNETYAESYYMQQYMILCSETVYAANITAYEESVDWVEDAPYYLEMLDITGVAYRYKNTTLLVEIGYDAEYGCAYMFTEYSEAPLSEWPAEIVADYLAKYRDDAATVPPFIGSTTSYTASDYAQYGYKLLYIECIGATEDDLTTYVAACEEAGFDVSIQTGSYGDYYQIIPVNESWLMAASYDDGQVNLELYPQPKKLAEYPAEKINAFFEGFEVGTLPTISVSADGYFLLEDGYVSQGALILGVVDADDTPRTAYITALETAGWVAGEPDEDGYIAFTLVAEPDAAIQVSPFEDGEFSVIFAHAVEAGWSAELQVEFAQRLDGVVPPYVEGFGSSMAWNSQYEEFGEAVSGDATAVCAATLQEAGWTYEGMDDSQGVDMYFYSTTGDTGYTVYAYYYYYESAGMSYLGFYASAPAGNDWSDELKAEFAEKLDGFVPTFVDGYDNMQWYDSLEYEGCTGGFEGYASCDVSVVIASLINDGFVDSGLDDGYGNILYIKETANGNVYACVWSYYDVYAIWDMYYIEGEAPTPATDWSDDLKAEFAEKLDGVVPSYVAGFGNMAWYDATEDYDAGFEGYTTTSVSSVATVQASLLSDGFFFVEEIEGEYIYAKETDNGVVKSYVYEDDGYVVWGFEFATVGGVTVSKTIEAVADALSWENGKQYLEFSLDDVITVKAAGSDSNTGKYYSNGENWRLYVQGAATLTIEAPEGYEIVSVTIVYSCDESKESGLYKRYPGVLQNGGVDVASGETIEVGAQSITLSAVNGPAREGSADSPKAAVIYIESITVVYQAVSE